MATAFQQPHVWEFPQEPTLDELKRVIEEMQGLIPFAKALVTFRRPINVIHSRGKWLQQARNVRVRLTLSKGTREPMYTFFRSNGYLFAQIDFRAVERITYLPDGWEDPVEWAEAQAKLLAAFHPNAWADLRSDQARLARLTVKQMKLHKIKDLPLDIRKQMREAFKDQSSFSVVLRQWRKGTNYEVEVAMGKESSGAFHAFYREQALVHVTVQKPDGHEVPRLIYGREGKEWKLVNPTQGFLPIALRFGKPESPARVQFDLDGTQA